MLHHPLYEADIEKILEANLPWNKLKQKHVLIAGATGMVGTVLVDALMRCNAKYGTGMQVTVLSRSEEKAKARLDDWWEHEAFRYIQGDVCASLSTGERYDYLIQAASNTHPLAYSGDPVGTMTANLFGTYQLLRYAAETKAERFLFVSSVEIYGQNRGDAVRFEEGYCGYIDCNTLRAGYPESKRAAEALCQAFAAQYGLPVLIARLARVYGPTMRWDDSKASSQFIRKAVCDEDIVLKSAGQQIYSYCYAADAVEALLTILTKGTPGEAYNVADMSGDCTLREMASYLAEFAGRRVVYATPSVQEAAGYSKADKALLDGRKLEKLGWRARVDIRAGLARTLRVLRETEGDR